MNEAERCDRISLMHAGKVSGGRNAGGAAAREAGRKSGGRLPVVSRGGRPGGTAAPVDATALPGAGPARAIQHDGLRASWRRIWAFAYREMRELARDRVRIAFALLGPLVLLMTFGYGITFDVENLSFAVLDRDRTAESRQFIESFSGSRYFREHRRC